MISVTQKNIIANYLGKLWGFVSIFLFVPVYNRLLGPENYGLIAFYSVVLATLSFIDAGISSAINREFAKTGADSYKVGILKRFEMLYASLCVVIILVLVGGADLIARRWLQTTSLSDQEVAFQIRLIGIGVGIQLIGVIYTGALMGLQKQVLANGIQTGWSSLKPLGAIFLLYYVSRSLTSFFLWNIVCNVIYVVVLRMEVLKTLHNARHTPPLALRAVDRNVWTYLSGMVFISVLSAANIQIDKLVTSKLFSLEQFGNYYNVSLLAQIPVLAATSVAVAVFPVLTKLTYEKKQADVLREYRTYSFYINILVAGICCGLFFYGRATYLLWMNYKSIQIGDTALHEVDLLLKLLALGNTFLALQFMPFYLLLALGKTRYSLLQTAGQLLLIIPCLLFFIKHYGLVGGGISWLVMNLAGFMFITVIVSTQYLKKQSFAILFSSYLIPMLLTITVNWVLYLILPFQTTTGIVLYGVFAGSLTLLINIFVKKYLYK